MTADVLALDRLDDDAGLADHPLGARDERRPPPPGDGGADDEDPDEGDDEKRRGLEVDVGSEQGSDCRRERSQREEGRVERHRGHFDDSHHEREGDPGDNHWRRV